MAVERHAANARTIDDATWRFAQEKLLQQWSPEQISGHSAISHETACQRFYADRRTGEGRYGCIYAVRSSAKHYGKINRRGVIPARLSFEYRPAIVDERKRTGNWEADTVIDKSHRQTIVSYR